MLKYVINIFFEYINYILDLIMFNNLYYDTMLYLIIFKKQY